MNYMLNQADVIIHTLGWTLLHSLWQCLLLFAILKLVFAFIPQASARIKYILAYTALSGMFVWFVITWVQQWQSLRATAVFVLNHISNAQVSRCTITSVSNHTQVSNNHLQNILVHLENYMPLIVSLYCLGITLMLLRFFVNLDKIRQLRRNGLTNLEQDWIEKTEKWVARLSITRSVSIYISDRIHVPSAIGTLKPVILLPITAFSHLSAEQLEAVILHELAHIKRYDYLLNIIQTVVETILFFNPFMWRVTAMIRQEREHCCDDLVVAYTKQPLCYAQALATIETYRTNTNTLALAAAGVKTQLFNRIKRIMEMKKHAISYSHIVITILIICAFISSIFCLTPSYAQTAKKKTTTKMIVTNNGDTTLITTNKVIVETDGDSLGKKKQHNNSYSFSSKDDNDKDDDLSSSTRNDYYILKDIDTVFVDKEIQNATKDVDWDEMRKNVKKNIHLSMDSALYYSVKKYNQVVMEKVMKYHDSVTKKSLEKVKEYEERNRELISRYNKMNLDDVDSLESAMRSSTKHTKDMDNYDKLIDKMESDGLIDRDKGFEIEKRMNNVLYINGKKQDQKIYTKYCKYFIPSRITISGRGKSVTTMVIY